MEESAEFKQAAEVMGRVFEVMPQLTEAQKQLILTAGARLYNRGCANMAQAVLHAQAAGREMRET